MCKLNKITCVILFKFHNIQTGHCEAQTISKVVRLLFGRSHFFNQKHCLKNGYRYSAEMLCSYSSFIQAHFALIIKYKLTCIFNVGNLNFYEKLSFD